MAMLVPYFAAQLACYQLYFYFKTLKSIQTVEEFILQIQEYL